MADEQKDKVVRDNGDEVRESFTLWLPVPLRQKLNRLAIKRSTEHRLLAPQDVLRDLILKARE